MSDLPDKRAACTKSALRRLKVAPLTFRAKKGMLTIATAISAFSKLGPKIATIAKAKSTYGKAIKISIDRIKKLSIPFEK